MTTPHLLTLTELVAGLERHNGRYQALDVFHVHQRRRFIASGAFSGLSFARTTPTAR